MEFGSSQAYAYGSYEEEDALASYTDEDSGVDQPKLKPSHFLPPPLSLIDEIPALEDEQMTASLAVHRISTPEITPLKEVTHSLDRAKSDGYLLGLSPDLSPPPSATGKTPKKKKGRFKPLRGILKKFGRKMFSREGSIHVQFEENGQASPGPSPPAAPVPRSFGVRQATGKPRKRGVHHADTNVLAVRFNTLAETPVVHTGDAVVCENAYCAAVISHVSKLTECDESESGNKIWKCEYCGTENKVDISQDEIPKGHQVTFMMAPPPVQTGGAAAGSSMEDSVVVFCIDISGSMCVTTPVPGNIELRGSEEIRRRRHTSVHGHADDPSNQYMPRERRDVTYISRLQSIQSAVDQQMDSLARSHPSQRVALITFNNEVAVIGDGKCGETIVAGDRLSNPDALAKTGAQLPLPSCIRECKDDLSRKIFSLEENGQTALGPALLLSVFLAARVPGSRVIICTDGLANKGVGSLDGLKTDESFATAQVFYKDLGDIAMENGVTVSLVTIRGTECRVLELGQVADRTGGTVNIVDPHTVATEFGNILANPIIATNVTTKIVLHKQLYFTSEEIKGCVLTAPVGNVNADTEFFYGYGFSSKPKQEASPTKSVFPSQTLSQLPFQVQIDYSAFDGSRYLKVITRAQPITTKKEEAESGMNFGIVGAHAVRRTASLAAEGKFTEARISSEESQKLLKRSSQKSDEERSHFTSMMENMSQLESRLQEKERMTNRRLLPSASKYDSLYVEATSMRRSLDTYLPRLPSRASRSDSTAAPRSVSLPMRTLTSQRAIDDDLASELLMQRRTRSLTCTREAKLRLRPSEI